MANVNAAIRPLVEKLWDYHQLHHEVSAADAGAVQQAINCR